MPLLLRPPLKQGGGWGFYTILFPFVSSPCDSSPFLLLSFSFFFFFLDCHRAGSLLPPLSGAGEGGGPWVAPSPPPLCTPRAVLSLLILSETKMHVIIRRGQHYFHNNCYDSTSTVYFLCPRYSTFGPDRSKNSSTILGRLISSGFFVSMNTDRGVGHAQ